MITVGWGHDVTVTITLTVRNWSRVLRGRSLSIRGAGYRYEGVFYWDHWIFGGGFDGPLRVEYGEGLNRGVGFEGTLPEASIRELP